MKKSKNSLEVMWRGCTRDRNITYIGDGKVRVSGLNPSNNTKYYKDVTHAYAERILGDAFIYHRY